MEELRNIIKEVKKMCKEELNDDVTSDIILDCSTRIFNAHLINYTKLEKSPEHQPDTRGGNSPMLATEKQIAFLKRNKYQGDISKLTKYEAKVLISEFLDNQRKEKDCEDYPEVAM